MGFGNALLSGDECYSKGLFDEAIKYYTEAANQGYVEGMEKLLKTCVEQGRNDDNMVNKKGLHYWGMASSTLRGIMNHAEIGREVKDRSYKYYDEIMYGLALACMWAKKYKEAEHAWEKVSRQETVAIKILKANCDYHRCLDICRELASSVLENMNLSLEEKAKKILPIPTSWTIDLDEFDDDVHKQILSEKSCSFELAVVMMALFDFLLFFYVGIVENMALAEQDKDKAFKCWKILKGLDLTGKAPLPDVIEKDFQKRLEEEKYHSKATSNKQVKVESTSTKRKITINRPKKLMCGLLKVKISVDEVEKAVLKNGESTILELDGKQHIIYCVAKALDGTVYESMGYIPADSEAHTIEIDVNKRSLLMDGTAEINKIKEIKTAWMNTSFEVKEFLWLVEQLFTPESMHKIGEKSILEKYDQVRITSVGYKKLMLSAKYWNSQEGRDSYVDIPIPYDNSKLELKNSYETERLGDMITERLKGLPHIALKGIYYRLIQ